MNIVNLVISFCDHCVILCNICAKCLGFFFFSFLQLFNAISQNALAFSFFSLFFFFWTSLQDCTLIQTKFAFHFTTILKKSSSDNGYIMSASGLPGSVWYSERHVVFFIFDDYKWIWHTKCISNHFWPVTHTFWTCDPSESLFTFLLTPSSAVFVFNL